MKRSNQFQNLGLICFDFAWEIPVSLGLLPVYLGVFRLRLGHHRFFQIVRTQKNVLGLCFKNPLTGEFLIFVGEIMWNPMESPESTWDSDPPEVPWRASVCLQPSNRSCNPWCSAVWSRSQGLGKILGKRRREAELDCQKGHLGMKTPMELQNPMELRGVWRNLQAVTSHIFPGNLTTIPHSVLDVRQLGDFT